MKLQLRLKFIPKLLVLLLFFFGFAPLQALATPYGGCAYGGDSRVENCLKSSTSITVTQPPDKSFFDKYGWVLFAGLILLSAVLFILLLLARRRKKSDEKDQRKSPPLSKARS